MYRRLTHLMIPGIALLFALAILPLETQAAAEPGATVRNAFGPDVGLGANQCRGACGGGCPRSCARDIAYECSGQAQLRRIVSYRCGTHKGCRDHDDCLDNCISGNTGAADCQSRCDAAVMENYGFESAAAWLLGKGPYDGETTFEYTRHGPTEPEPAYRCPEGAARRCGGNAGCVAASGEPVDPVFDAYPAVRGAMQISGLRTGPLCDGDDNSICGQSTTISITGEDTCPGGECTRFGMEFDYRNADPSAPLTCATSTRNSEDDFVGDLIKLGGDAVAERNAATGGPAEDDGMGQLMDTFAKVIASGDSPEDVDITMTPMDENGRPIESQAVGSSPRNGPAPIPRSIALPAASGHLFVPMYQPRANLEADAVKERRITCTHKGQPVLETVFVLQANYTPRTPLEKQAAELRRAARDMEQSIQKSSAQQRDFKDEADALEAELGF